MVHTKCETKRTLHILHALRGKRGDERAQPAFMHSLNVIEGNGGKLRYAILIRRKHNFGRNIADVCRDGRNRNAGQKANGRVACENQYGATFVR